MSRKSVLITGCSEGGIGNGLALEWKSRGYRVFATARTMRSMATLERAEIECFEMDVTNLDSLKSVNDQIAQKTGGTLDILVNCAGQGYTMPLLDTDLDIAKRVFDVNVFGVIRTIQAFSSLVIAAEGTIVIIGSSGGVFPYPFGGIYGASKSAVQHIADTLRFEMYPFKVKVLNICTGGIKTQIANNARKNFDHGLPQDSVYSPIETQVKSAEDSRLESFMDIKDYVKYVVAKVNKATRSGWIWRGAFSNTIWFVTTFLWKTALDSVQLKENGLKELKKTVEMKKKKSQ